ncbi:MAG: metallophosphoesterase family protein [Sphingomicrobium sp.]
MLNFAPVRDVGPAGARGLRAYAIGDIHGRLDLLDQLLEAIEKDLARRPVRRVMLVFVGDLIDRGPASAQVVERLRTYRHRHVRTVFLLGNHEEVLLRILGGNTELITKWRTFGGAECLQSYGVNPRDFAALDEAGQLAAVRSAVPSSHVEFLESFVDTCRFGDYLFVHAGIRPGVDLDQQRQSDLRWIREPFLLDDTDHGFVVVHGHTITTGIEERPNRIGIDTGAYRSGVLTALAIEGSKRWHVDTGPSSRPTEVPER